jgi:hypothetical protein
VCVSATFWEIGNIIWIFTCDNNTFKIFYVLQLLLTLVDLKIPFKNTLLTWANRFKIAGVIPSGLGPLLTSQPKTLHCARSRLGKFHDCCQGCQNCQGCQEKLFGKIRLTYYTFFAAFKIENWLHTDKY